MTTTLTKTKPSTKPRKTLSLPKKTASKVVESKSAPAAPASQPERTPLAIATPALAAPVSAPAAAPTPVVVDESKVKTKKAKAPAPAKPAKAPGKSVRIYEATWNHPELAAPQLAALLIAEGLESTVETIGTISSDFKRSVNWLASRGLMKSPFIKE